MDARDITLLYETLLGRTPGPQDIDAHREADDWRHLLGVIAASPEFAARTGETPAELQPVPQRSGGTWAERHPPPADAWTPEYEAARWRLIADAIADEDLLAGLRSGAPLPGGFGGGFDERVVEYPWLMAHLSGERVLDAGSVMNFAPVLDRVAPPCDLTIVTLAPEPESFPERAVSYVYADLRDLPFRDGRFDLVCCISTLEHVGCDTSVYGREADRGAGPQEEAVRAAREMRRVVAPGGRLLLSVPFGRPSNFGWGRQFGGEDLDGLIAAFEASSVTERIAQFGLDGWRWTGRAEVSDLDYHDALNGPLRGDDGATAARAVACLELWF